VEAYAASRSWYVDPSDAVIQQAVRNPFGDVNSTMYVRAGPREESVFAPEEVKAAVVTCGGLCPGLNTVVREVVQCLVRQYGVPESQVWGVEGGYRGFYSRNLVDLNLDMVESIHNKGGTMLGTSRGGHDTKKIVDAIEDRGINHVYIIGGDGTQRGADAIYKEVRRRGLKVAVVGIPKTIDNDVCVIDKSFGFDTAVEEAQRAINAAYVEADSAIPNGVGLVKLMGRHAGFIAMHATLASRVVDLCLIPEVEVDMEGPEGVLAHVARRLEEQGRCIIVVAEGAGQEYLKDVWSGAAADASGNRMLADIGLWLGDQLKVHFRDAGNAITLKYIDPTYMIRAVAANGSDNIYCTLLAHNAVHAAFAGFTGVTVGPVNGRHALIPLRAITGETRTVDVEERMWARTVLSTRQPLFYKAGPKPERPPAQAPKQEIAGVKPVGVANGGGPAQPKTNGAQAEEKKGAAEEEPVSGVA
jgi:6-phosphofructokinase 1